MRPRIVLEFSLFVLSAVCTAASGEEKVDGAAIAYGALSSLHASDAFGYRLVVPKHGFVGGPNEAIAGGPPRPPTKPEDYETKFIKLVVVKATEGEVDKGLRLRIDETDAEGKVAKRGIYDMELINGPGGKQAKFRSPTGETGWWSVAYYTMLPFINYPPLEKIEPNSGKKYFVVKEYEGIIQGYQVHAPADGKSVVVECQDFWTPAPGDRATFGISPTGYPMPETWLFFFDPAANNLVSQPRGSGDLYPALLKLVERQEWEPGMPFWSSMTRWTDTGIRIRSAELIRRVKVPLQELTQQAEAPSKGPDVRPAPPKTAPETRNEEPKTPDG